MAKVIKIIAGFTAGLLGLVVAVAVGGWVYLNNANLADLAIKLVKSQTGLELQATTLEVKLWPAIHIQTTGLVVPAFSGNAPLVQLERGDIKLAWGPVPFIHRGIALNELTLINPVVHLEQPAAGLPNWQNPAQAAAANGAAAPAGGGLPTSLPLATLGVLDVQNLRLTYLNTQANHRVQAEDVNLRLDGTNIAATAINLTGRVNGQALNGNLTTNLTDLAMLPIQAKLAVAGLQASVQGTAEPAAQAFTGAVKLTMANVQSTLKNLLGNVPQGVVAAPLNLNTELAAGPENINVKQFSLTYAELIKASGQADVKLGAKPSATGQIQASGNNLRALAAAATGQAQPMVPASPFTLATKLAGQNEIKLDNLSVNLPGVLALTGNLALVPPATAGATPLVNGNVALQTTNVAATAKAFGVAGTFPTQPLNVATNVATEATPQGARYALNELQARLGNLATLKADLVVAPTPTPSASGKLELRGDNLAAAAAAFGTAGGLPTTPFSADLTVAGSSPISLNPLRISLPGLLEASGELAYTPAAAGKVQDVAGRLNITTLNLNALGLCAPGGNTAPASIEAAQNVQSADAPWTDDPLPLDALRTTTANLTLTAKGIACASAPLEALDATIRNTASALELADVQLNLGRAGALTTSLNLTHAGTPSLQLAAKAAKLAVEELVPQLKERGAALPVALDATLTASGANTRALASSLAGPVNLTGDAGRLPFGNLLGNVVALERLLNGQVAGAGGNDAVDDLAAKLVFTNGIGTFETLRVATGGGAFTATGEGKINLPAWLIDLTLTPQVNTANALSVPVEIKGPLTAPAIAASPAAVQKLSGRLAGEALKLLGVDKDNAKGLGGALGGVLSGQQGAGQAAGQLLNNFLAPKPQPAPAEAAPAAQPEANPAPAAEEPAAPTPVAADPVGELLNVLGQ